MKNFCETLLVALTFLLWLICMGQVNAQDTKISVAHQADDFSNNCESNIAILDDVDHRAGKDSLIIAIARLSDSEKLRELNRRRLHNVRTYLVEFRGRELSTIILAEGERVKGFGRVELYVGGKLVHTLKVGRGEDLYAGSCDGTSELDKLLYDSRRRKLR